MSEDRLNWKHIVRVAAEIVESYDTGVTLRQLFYRLVSRGLIPNKQAAYKRLSAVTAEARRNEEFPELIDNTRLIRRPNSWDGAKDVMEQTIAGYRRDRTEGQEYSIYVGVEKNALATLIAHWFSEKGISVLAFGGYPSQTFVDDIKTDIAIQGRPAVLLYGGDFDATGVDILRDFENRTEGSWDDVQRIALNPEQIKEFSLPPLPGKSWDPRAAGFIETYGQLVQVELDALPPDVLKKIYEDAVAKFWDEKIFKKSLKQEKKDRKQLMLPSDVKDMLDSLESVIDAPQNPKRIPAIEPGVFRAKAILDKYEGIF